MPLLFARDRCRIAFAMTLALMLGAQMSAAQTTSQSTSAPTALPQPSASGQRLFDAARDKLVQVRILTQLGGTQSTVGSGFLIDAKGTALTNYHVISNLVLEPERYRAEYVGVDGKRGSVKLLSFDVIHDLATVKLEGVAQLAHFNLRAEAEPLKQGEKIYSLGNPMDLGFAISEGTYNGLVERRLYDTIHFTGALNPGMSGGPAVDEQGRVIGVNVAGTGGELANLLVPLRYVRPLLAKTTESGGASVPDKKSITPQLLSHQAAMIGALLAKPLMRQSLGPATVAVGDDKLLRCWGQSSEKPDKPYRTETTRCSLQSSLYIDRQLQTGTVSWDHTYRSGKKLGAMRFAAWHGKSLQSSVFGDGLSLKPTRYLTRPHCRENYVENAATAMHVSVCTRAHREFSGLFDMKISATSVDRSTEGVSSNLDIRGVSFENGQRLMRSFLEATTWTK
ncbi:MAG: serine protease [Betaproteobacteria bacterium]|nr:MAG: serine protease [Betaproteobacteria bacterium]